MSPYVEYTSYFDYSNWMGFKPHVQYMLLHLQNVIFFA